MLAAITLTASAHRASAAVTASAVHQKAVHTWRHKARFRRNQASHLARRLGIHYRPRRAEIHMNRIVRLQHLTRHYRLRGNHFRRIIRHRFPNLMCIHHHEGSWSAYNPAGYYGGFQMDFSFMRHWGADKLRKYHGRDARYWSPADQLAVASRAVAHIGYSPWPNTGAMCGL
jgi:hypothetical protein